MSDTVRRRYQARFEVAGDRQMVAGVRNIGQAAKKSEGEVDGLATRVGQLSEKLDRDLEDGLGKSFRAFDRVTGVIGQVTNVFALLSGTVIAGLITEFANLTGKTKEQEEAQRALEERTEELKRRFEEARSAVEGFASQLGKSRFELDTQLQLQVIQSQRLIKFDEQRADFALRQLEIANETLQSTRAQREELEKRVAGARLDHQATLTARKMLHKLRLVEADAAEKVAENEAKFRDASNKILERQIGLQNKLADERQMQAELDAANEEILRDIAKERADVRSNVASAAEREREAVRQAIDDMLFMEEVGETWDDVLGTVDELTEKLGEDMVDALAGLEDRLDRARDAGLEQADAMHAQLDAIAIFSDEMQRVETMLVGVRQGLAAAAVDALIFGQSFEHGVNLVAQAAVREAGIGVLLETAKGLAALAQSIFYPPAGAAATAHFAAAGVYAGIAAVAGVTAAATGGLGGGAGAGATSVPQLGPPSRQITDERAERDRQPIEVNQNFNLQGAILTPRDQERAIGGMAARGLGALEHQRGRNRFRAGAFDRAA